MAIQTPKKKQGSQYPKISSLITSLAKQLGPKKNSANTRIQGSLQQEASSFFADKKALEQTEKTHKVRITITGSELTVLTRAQ